MNGTVKWFDGKKGFGFIGGDDGKDVFIHHSAIEGMTGFKTLNEGQRVSYEVALAPRGLQAQHLKVLVEGSDEESKNQGTAESQ